MPADFTDFIISQLRAQGVHIRSMHGSNILAYCVTGHDHKSASLSIRKVDGMFNCFGCGIKGQNWNALQAYLPNIELIPEQDLPDKSTLIAIRLRDRLRAAVLEMQLPWGIEPWVGTYRHASQYTLDALGACKWFDPLSHCYRILFPVTVERDLVGWAARRLDSSDDQRYRNSTGFQSKRWVFPFDVTAQLVDDTVVLVEGPYDAIRLVNMNIPAVCIFGTKNYTSDKKGIISRLGVERVVLALDNDHGGEGARLDMALDLRTQFIVEHFLPPPGKDPGNMPIEAVHYLAAMVRRRVTPERGVR